MKLQDERAAYRRVVRDQARREVFVDRMVDRVTQHDTPLGFKPKLKAEHSGQNDIIMHLTDIHTGIGISNNWNKYDQNVLISRLCEYIQQVFEIQQTHGSENVFVILGGDLISGGIHPTLRIENNEDMIDQVLTICELLAQVLAELSRIFETVHVYLTPGNHGRIQANKDQDIAHENLDNFILPYLKAKLQNYDNIICHENDFEQSIAVFEVRGQLVYASHGDRDKYKTATQKLTMLMGRKPDIIYLGHMHHNAMDTQAGTKVIQSGSLSGMDQYCVDKRIPGQPEQTASVVTDNGLLCNYYISFTR